MFHYLASDGRRRSPGRGSRCSGAEASRPASEPVAAATSAWASSISRSRWSSPRKLSAYTLVTFSVPDGRAANQPNSVVTLRPPMGAPLPGALVRIAVIGSPARSVAVTSAGESRARAAFCSGVAGASIRR